MNLNFLEKHRKLIIFFGIPHILHTTMGLNVENVVEKSGSKSVGLNGTRATPG